MSPVPSPGEVKQAREVKQKERDHKALVLKQAKDIVKGKFDKLTEKQRNFVMLQVENPGWSPTRCARESGYKLTSGARASGIVKSIEGKLGNVFADCFQYDEYDLCRTLVDAARRATIKTFTVIKQYDPETGKVTSERIVTNVQPDHKTRLFAARMIARTGTYEAAARLKVEHSGTMGLEHFSQEMSMVEADRRERELSDEIEADFEVVDEPVN